MKSPSPEAIERARRACYGRYGADTTEINVGVLCELIYALSGSPQPQPVALHIAAERVLAMCDAIGDFRNGVTDPTGTTDEGEVRAGELLQDLRRALSAPAVEPVAVMEAQLLFDFGGFLTCSERRWVFSSRDDASPMVEAIRLFAERKGINLDDPPASPAEQAATQAEQFLRKLAEIPGTVIRSSRDLDPTTLSIVKTCQGETLTLSDGLMFAIVAAPTAPTGAQAEPEQHGYVKVIDVEKLLCSKLGIEWSPAGISIVTLIDRLAEQASPEDWGRLTGAPEIEARIAAEQAEQCGCGATCQDKRDGCRYAAEQAAPKAEPWRIATNRHPNTDGTRWGWIDGAPGHICWSDERGSNLTRAQAGQMVKDHNDALAAQPVAGHQGGDSNGL